MMTCNNSRRQSTRVSSTSSIPDELNCSFESAYCENLMNSSKNIRLQVGSLLGSGGFGEVFEGRCSGRHIALKRLRNYNKNPHAIAESYQAEKAVMSMYHRNIVRILAATNESVELKNDRLVVMEFAGKRNLLTVINDDKFKLTSFLRLKFATDIANALHYIHRHSVAHLDVKPANIMITYKNSCKLGDFGCCKYLDNGEGSPTTPTNSYLTGTLAYRSPELLKGEQPSYKADMYSYGICLWQLLTRRRPYGNENMYVVIFGVVAYELRPECTPRMEHTHGRYIQLVKALWRSDPTKRPSAQTALLKLRQLKNMPNASKSQVGRVTWRL